MSGPVGAKHLSVAHAAELLDVSRAQIYELIGKGEFSVLRVGTGRHRSAVRIPVAELEDFIKRRTVPRTRKGAA